jgi:hypothetical protein
VSPAATRSLLALGVLMLALRTCAGRAAVAPAPVVAVAPAAAPLEHAAPTAQSTAAERNRFADALYVCREGVKDRATPLVVDFDFLGMSKLMPTGLTGTTSDGIVLDGTATMTVSFTVLNGQVQRTGVCVFLGSGKLWGVRLDGEESIILEPTEKPAARSAPKTTPRRKSSTAPRKTERLELPCRPGQPPPCFD